MADGLPISFLAALAASSKKIFDQFNEGVNCSIFQNTDMAEPVRSIKNCWNAIVETVIQETNSSARCFSSQIVGLNGHNHY